MGRCSNCPHQLNLWLVTINFQPVFNGKPLGEGGMLACFASSQIIWGLWGTKVSMFFKPGSMSTYFIGLLWRWSMNPLHHGIPPRKSTVMVENTWDIPGQLPELSFHLVASAIFFNIPLGSPGCKQKGGLAWYYEPLFLVWLSASQWVIDCLLLSDVPPPLCTSLAPPANQW